MLKSVAAVLLVAGAMLCAMAGAQLPTTTDRQTGTVKGTVKDFNDAVIPATAVTFEGERVTRKAIADEAGNYAVELPEGIYKVSTEGSSDYLPFRRAAVRVQPGVTKMINITLATSPYPIGILQVGSPSKTSRSSKLVPPKYETHTVPQSPETKLDLLIEFSKKRVRDSVTKYSKATASYDDLIIYAEQVRFDRETARLEATGDRVIVEDGKRRVRAKRAVVEFRAGEPVVELTQ